MSIETAGLFPDGAYRVEIEPLERISPDRRRTLRQAAAVARGAHPLALVFGPMAFRRHPMTKGHAYSAEDTKGDRWTCGSCKWRQTVHYHNRSYPKCVHPGGYSGDDVVTLPPLWHSHSAATDVRAWWPACTRASAEAVVRAGHTLGSMAVVDRRVLRSDMDADVLMGAGDGEAPGDA